MDNLSAIAGVLGEAESVLVSSHVSPDPDAISSSVGLAWGLEQLGKGRYGLLSGPNSSKT